MSAAAIDAALASAVEAIIAGTYRLQSDVQLDRERIDPTNIGYGLIVEQLNETPDLSGNRPTRQYAILLQFFKRVETQAAERAYRLGDMATIREQILSRAFYQALGQELLVDATNPEVTESSEVVGRVMRFTMEAQVRQRA